MTPCRTLPRQTDEELWETEGEQGRGEGGPSKAERVGPRHITAHFERTILKISRKYILGQCFFSELSQMMPVNVCTIITPEALSAGCGGGVRRLCVALKSTGTKRWAQTLTQVP